jgi:hypothetical protein
LPLDASVSGSSHTVCRALLTPRPPFARYRETIARVIADLESDRKKSPVGTDSLSQQPAEKSPVESDPARTGPTPE